MSTTQNQPIIDSQERIAQLDSSNMLGSLRELDKQIQEAWEQTRTLKFTPTAKITSVVIAGMGGSALGGHLLRSVFHEELPVPVVQVRDYTLPGFVDEHTLVLLSSYSGSTEEVLSCANEAIGKKAQIMVISAGGPLIDIAKKHGYTHYQIDPSHNPSNQPRMALGYSVFGSIGMLSAAGIFTLSEEAVEETIAAVREQIAACDVASVEDNRAKLVAYLELDRFPLLIAPDFLAGSIHAATNQHNENAKTLAQFHVIPELNHHLLEGAQFPSLIRSSHIAVLIQSKLAHVRNQRRITLTAQLLEEASIETATLELHGKNKLAQAFELITILGFAGFYLSMLEGIDPSPIPQVESFKKKLD